MDKVFYYNDLYDLYGDLLTDKQRLYFEDYYFNNLSFSEMAENYNISRNAIFKQIHIVTDKLEEYEQKLSLYKKKKIVDSLLDKIEDADIKAKLSNLF